LVDHPEELQAVLEKSARVNGLEERFGKSAHNAKIGEGRFT